MKNGIYRFDLTTNQFTRHLATYQEGANQLTGNTIGAFGQIDDYLLIGLYYGGLNILSEKQNKIFHFKPDKFNPAHKNFDVVRSILKDRHGNTWLGTQDGGAKILKKKKKPFRTYTPTPGKPNALKLTQFASLFEREDGKILISGGSQIILFDPQEETFSSFFEYKAKAINIGTMLQISPNTLLVNTYKDGLAKLQTDTKTWTPLSFNDNPLKQEWLTFMTKDKNENVWIGSMNGLFKYDVPSNTIQSYKLPQEDTGSGNNQYIHHIITLSNGAILISTQGGLNHFDTDKELFTYYPSPTYVNGACRRKDGKIWVGNGSGLAIFDPADNTLSSFTQAPALQNRSSGPLLQDDNNNLWLVSNYILRLSPDGSLREYNSKDGILNTKAFHTAFVSKSGEIYVAGPKGLDRFDPEMIKNNDIKPAIAITKFELFNEEVPVWNTASDSIPEGPFLEQDIAYTKELRLLYHQNEISFQFAALDFTAPENNRYQYQLEGYQNVWVETDASNRTAHYTNLTWGEYTFRVRGTNNDGVGGEETRIQITILPPWWATWWAYLLYVILIGGSAYLITNAIIQRRLEQAEAERLKELDRVKTQLYTNITHEFRTPLTIIMGMAEHVKLHVSEAGKEGLQLIKRNSQQLLNLVNQMLDLSKLEAGSMQLSYIQGDIINYLKYLVDSFQSYASQHDIRLHFLAPVERLLMDFDPPRLQQIMVNLLSNAIKYSSESGDVYIQLTKNVNESTLIIEVKDTGIGIAEEKIPYIFDRFYQADDNPTRSGEGTGIGLALTKELVQLMQGEIKVRSQLGIGTTFRITLPIKNEAQLMSALPELFHPTVPLEGNFVKDLLPVTNGTSDRPQLLLIEDNVDVMKYLIACLQNRFQLELAYDGAQGVEKALKAIPDLIISDVMMPQMDGYEVCTTLKSDEKTSHIPIILLTAKADIQSKLSGLAKGADAYLSKPFDKIVLLTRIQQLLEAQKRLQSYYQAEKKENATRIVKNKPEDQKELDFLKKIEAFIEVNLEDYQFSVEKLAHLAELSQAQLNRKLKAIVGRSSGKLIKSYRLQKAKNLLQKTNLTIAEIANKVGFQDADYFSKVFKQEEGKTPSEFRQ